MKQVTDKDSSYKGKEWIDWRAPRPRLVFDGTLHTDKECPEDICHLEGV